MMHYIPYHNPYKIGQADKIMGRECRSPWAHMGYAGMRKTVLYTKGFMETEEAICE